ncbi:hypothetical protein AKO1_006919 [Acrasis kona]|uniref:Uncharacterized protein n=1 Tax=Acrasis kona TaxID=1008807 RepID=A0AAW2YUJ3_9EUKA
MTMSGNEKSLAPHKYIPSDVTDDSSYDTDIEVLDLDAIKDEVFGKPKKVFDISEEIENNNERPNGLIKSLFASQSESNEAAANEYNEVRRKRTLTRDRSPR